MVLFTQGLSSRGLSSKLRSLLSYRCISALMKKPVSTVSDIVNHLTTPPRRSEPTHLILYVRMNANHRRMILGQLAHALGYDCSHATIRRALAKDNYSQDKVRPVPFITDINKVRRMSYVDDRLQLPIFHWPCAWSDDVAARSAAGQIEHR